MTDVAQPEPTAKVPVWKNPYVIAFLLGVVVITLMRPLSSSFRKAPPPVRQLSPWSATSLGGGPVSLDALKGAVILATVELGPCESSCLERQTEFGTALRHLDDLGGKVVLLTLVGDEAQPGLAPLLGKASPGWRFAGGMEGLQPLLAELQASLEQRQAERDQRVGAPRVVLAAAHPIALIDQDGAVRDFWPADGAGRGNSINAARLLAQHGPKP